MGSELGVALCGHWLLGLEILTLLASDGTLPWRGYRSVDTGVGNEKRLDAAPSKTFGLGFSLSREQKDNRSMWNRVSNDGCAETPSLSSLLTL